LSKHEDQAHSFPSRSILPPFSRPLIAQVPERTRATSLTFDKYERWMVPGRRISK